MTEVRWLRVRWSFPVLPGPEAETQGLDPILLSGVCRFEDVTFGSGETARSGEEKRTQ